uniref:Uncharacterized protein n=1 Tax=viral metagenome TaxID=1070528 RepID=A0A6C0KDN1_9ZZZZ
MSKITKEEIYIDCQPVNSEGNVIIKEKNIIDVDAINQEITDDLFSKVLKSPYFSILIGAISAFALIHLSKFMIKNVIKK